MVNMLALYSDDLSSNPAEVKKFILLEKNENEAFGLTNLSIKKSHF